LSRFAVGEECDPRGLFRLSEDKWDGWQYDLNGMPSIASRFRFNFGNFQTFLKLYAKWYCYYKLLGCTNRLLGDLPCLPRVLLRADRYISEHKFCSIDDIAPSVVFYDLWDAQIRGDSIQIPVPRSATSVQSHTRAFWQRIKLEFGSPSIVPPIAPRLKVKPGEFAADSSKIIPNHVIRQLSNKLALHRRTKEQLSRFDHLRLCVLMLSICLGRRINETLLAPRGVGSDGPLGRYPAKSGSPEGALWFQFLPNKDGPADKVFISPEWEDLTLYCVRELIKYSDEVRRFAAPEEQGLLILVSRLNRTYWLSDRPSSVVNGKPSVTNPNALKVAAGNRAYLLKYETLNRWMNGYGRRKGVLELWAITVDGSADGPVYRLLSTYARHTRHSAVALDPQVSLLARQRDLNQRDPDAQFHYQHRLVENNDALLEKMREGNLIGRGVEWLAELLGGSDVVASSQHSFQSGRPSAMTPRIYMLVKNNPIFLQHNRVPCGICTLPQGPGGCTEFLNCTTAGEGGCHFFVIDVSDPQILYELNNKAEEERRLHGESASAGRVVQAQKRAALACRAEGLRDEAMRRASKETLIELHRLQSKIEEEGL
jgi:hypothetical protein